MVHPKENDIDIQTTPPSEVLHPMTTSWREMKFHPLADKFPPVTGRKFASIAASIGPEGPDDPIITYQGMILDGRTRFRICLERNIEPRFEERDGRSGSPEVFVIHKNLDRRELGQSQKAMLALKFKEELAQEARANMSRGGKGWQIYQSFIRATKRP